MMLWKATATASSSFLEYYILYLYYTLLTLLLMGGDEADSTGSHACYILQETIFCTLFICLDNTTDQMLNSGRIISFFRSRRCG